MTGTAASDEEDEDTLFTEEEKETVRQSLGRFRKMVKESFDPKPEQERYIDKRLDHLAAAVDRLSRFDWRGVALSTVLSIATNLTVDTERGKALYALFKAAFQATTKLLQ